MNKRFLTECKKHFNEPVLVGLDVARLIGYAEDEDDCYFVLQYPYGPRHCKRVWHSFVGSFMSLRFLKRQGRTVSSEGDIWTDFTRVDSWLSLNGAPPAKEFQLEVRE